jgi:hypothetical protein
MNQVNKDTINDIFLISFCLLLGTLSTESLFSPGPPVCSINKTDYHDIAEVVLKER